MKHNTNDGRIVDLFTISFVFLSTLYNMPGQLACVMYAD